MAIVCVAIYFTVVEPITNEQTHLHGEVAGADVLAIPTAVCSTTSGTYISCCAQMACLVASPTREWRTYVLCAYMQLLAMSLALDARLSFHESDGAEWFKRW